MFNSVALDVAIGMVLIYLLYSLFVTLIGEIVATALGLRARMLRIAIERMLTDGEKIKPTLTRWQRFLSFVRWLLSIVRSLFLNESRDFKITFAGKFYDYPSIKYIGKVNSGQSLPWSKTKPAYITPANFAATVANMLGDHGTGTTKMDQIRSALRYNTLRVDPQTLKHLRNLYNSSANNLDNFKTSLILWYNETMDRANGWYKQKVKFILFVLGFIIAAGFNVDSIRIAKILSNDKEARNQLVSMGVAMARDSNRNKAYVHLGKDSIKTQAVIDSSLSHVSGDIAKANMVLGLGWRFPQVKKDSVLIKDLHTRKTYDFIATELAYLKDSIFNIDSLKKLNQEILLDYTEKKKLARRDSITNRNLATSKKATPKTVRKLDAALKLDSTEIANDNIQIKTSLDKIKSEATRLKSFVGERTSDIKKVNDRTDKKFIDIFNFAFSADGKSVLITGVKKMSPGARFGIIFKASFCSFSFLGFLLTALALSLGAPFWFGLLNKLVALRGAGVKPDEKDSSKSNSTDTSSSDGSDSSTSDTTSLLDTDIIATTVEELNFQYKNVSGVLNIFPGYSFDNDELVARIEIHVASPEVQTTIEAGIENPYNNIPIVYFINGLANFHLQGGDSITNVNFPDRNGTLGCLVKKDNDNGRYFMSCWHVLIHTADQIEDVNDNIIGTVLEGKTDGKIDVGFASLTVTDSLPTFNRDIGITAEVREISKKDIRVIKVSFKGGSKDASNVSICNDSLPPITLRNSHTGVTATLTDLFSIALLDANNNPTSPSLEGDSGAIVIDQNGCPIGMVVGGDLKYTYVTKLSNVFLDDNAYPHYKIPF